MKTFQFLKMLTYEGIPSFDYSITTKCNLNCAGCRDKSPISDSWFVSTEQFLHDQEQLIRLGLGNVPLSLYGGDPLVHPNIVELIKESKMKLGILTNGLGLLNQPDEFFELLLEKNIKVHISVYNRSRIPYDKIFKLLDSKGINYLNADIDPKMVNKEKILGKHCKNHFILSRTDPNGLYNKVEQYKRCCSVYPVIQNNNLFHCLTHNDLVLNDKFGLNLKFVEGTDYICLDKVKNIKEILSFLRRIPDYCRFCGSDGPENPNNEAILWRYSNKDKSEWVKD